ncbi:MAG: hypothetical protein NXI32_09675 [bacterium]|nr:hypothetical protein [bacterium]
MLSHGTFVWNGALDPTANDIDWDGDGFPDEFHEVPHGATSQSQAYHFPVSPPTLLPAIEFNSNSSRKQLDTKRPASQTVHKLDMHDQQLNSSNQTALRSLSIDHQFEQSAEDGLIEESLLHDLACSLRARNTPAQQLRGSRRMLQVIRRRSPAEGHQVV